jgi:hypothetical protein
MTMTIIRSRSSRRSRRIRTVLAVLACVVVAAVVAGAVVAWEYTRPPGPEPAFQMPVACGETWRLGTYPGHDDFDVDFFPKQGEAWGRPILAAYAGKVVKAGPSGDLGGRTQANPKGPMGSGGGYMVKVDHGGKWSTQYLHMIEQPMVKEGDRVGTGQQLGKIGSTGESGAPHLHYEVHAGWKKVVANFDGKPSGITTDDREYSVERKSANCPKK